MKVGRKPYTEPRVAWKIYLPQTTAAQVELILLDPVREKVKYGSRNELVERLLRSWLNDKLRKTRIGELPEVSDVDRLLAAIRFEILHFNLQTGDKIQLLLDTFEGKKAKGLIAE